MNAWWSGRVAAGHVRLPKSITRRQVGELCAAEALTARGGVLKWERVQARENHRWDGASLAIHGRHFRPLAASRRPVRLRAV